MALVVPDLRASSGGPAVNVPKLAEALTAAGVEVELHTVGEVPATAPASIDYRSAVATIPRRLGRSPELRRNLLRSTADVIHANCIWMLPLRYAAEAAVRRGVPLVISPRGMLGPWALQRSRWKKMVATRLVHPGAFHAASGWHATSEREAEDIRRLGYRQPVCVAPNGIEAPATDPAACRNYYAQRAPELVGRRVLLFYSRFHAKKRVRELLAEFARIAPRRVEWHLLAVGIPEQYSVEELRTEAHRLGIAGRVSILDGTDAPKPYAMGDLFALPTHDENFGRVIAEALVAGLPVITTTGTPWTQLDAIRAGRCVDLASFGAELEAMMMRPHAELREAGERGHRWALASLKWDGVAGTMCRFYQLLVGRAGTPQALTR